MLPEFGNFRSLTATSDAEAIVSGASVLIGVLVSATAGGALALQICNALTDGSEDDIVISQLDGTTDLYSFADFGGVPMNVGVTLDIQGTGQVTIFVNG